MLILDSRFLYSRGQVLRFDLPPPEPDNPPFWRQWWDGIVFHLRRSDYPVYQELGGSNGKQYPEVATSLGGSPAAWCG